MSVTSSAQCELKTAPCHTRRTSLASWLVYAVYCDAYLRLSKAILISAKTNIRRRFLPSYIPCMDTECQQLLEQYSNSGDPDIADHLVECPDNACQARWEEMTSSLDFTHSSRKGWNLIRKLSSGQQLPSSTRPSVKTKCAFNWLLKQNLRS